MFFFIFALLIVGVPGLEISATGTIDLEFEIGTSTGLGHLNSQPGHWLPTSSTTTQTAINLNPSCATSDAGGAGSHASSPALIATEVSTQTVTRTISRITLITVTVTAQLCTPLSGTAPPMTSSPGTNLPGTAPTYLTRNSTVPFRSWKMGTPPIPSTTISTSLGRSSTVSFKMGTPPIPSPTISIGSGRNALVQQVWPSFAVIAVVLGLSCL
ncbi:hypothetical protein HD806DRAFT_411898 [Xylariaceae sp. AK1471]|nr:hypothetical protein HD806DRAFT_411898 [Xylariaceae sp. AK1471]